MALSNQGIIDFRKHSPAGRPDRTRLYEESTEAPDDPALMPSSLCGIDFRSGSSRLISEISGGDQSCIVGFKASLPIPVASDRPIPWRAEPAYRNVRRARRVAVS